MYSRPRARLATEFVAGDSKRTFRFVKVIDAQPARIKCHGARFAPEIAASPGPCTLKIEREESSLEISGAPIR